MDFTHHSVYARGTVSSVKKSLAELRAEAEAIGALVLPEEVNPKPVPDDQNAALIYRRIANERMPVDNFDALWSSWCARHWSNHPTVERVAAHDRELMGDIDAFLRLSCDSGVRIENCLNFRYPEADACKHLARVLLVSADTALKQHDDNSFHRIMSAARKCGLDLEANHPGLIGVAYHVAVARRILSALIRTASSVQDRQLVAAILQEADHRPQFDVVRMVRAEMAVNLYWYERFHLLSDEFIRDWKLPRTVRLLRGKPWAHEAWNSVMYQWLIYIQRQMRVDASIPGLERAHRDWLKLRHPYLQRINLPISSGSLPVYRAMIVCEAQRRATLFLLRIIRDYESNWPTSPDRVPIDPVTGNPMGYGVSNGAFFVRWSLPPGTPALVNGKVVGNSLAIRPPKFSGKRESSGTL